MGRRYGYVSNVSKPRHVHIQLKLLQEGVKYYYQISSRNIDAALILTTTFQKITGPLGWWDGYFKYAGISRNICPLNQDYILSFYHYKQH